MSEKILFSEKQIGTLCHPLNNSGISSYFLLLKAYKEKYWDSPPWIEQYEDIRGYPFAVDPCKELLC